MKIFKRVLLLIIILIMGVCGFFTYQGYEMYNSAINEMPITEKISEIQSNENYTKIDDLPQMYKDAVIAAEDHRFYEHGAIDIVSIGRAMFKNLKELKLVEGGSTITQQLAKNTYFTQNKNINRKIAELFMAYKYEKECTKELIFELYVNTSYFGDGYYNVKEASEGYFDKEPIEMNDYESTLLAGIPNAPSVYAPTKNPELAYQRQKQVLNKMVKYKYITEEQVEQIIEKRYY